MQEGAAFTDVKRGPVTCPRSYIRIYSNQDLTESPEPMVLTTKLQCLIVYYNNLVIILYK